MPILFVLVGLPGSGKTTWRQGHQTAAPSLDCQILSQDDLIDAYAAEHGLSYSAAFAVAPLHVFDQTVRDRFDALVQGKRNIILDRTNMSVKSRRSFLDKVTPDYTTIAVVFDLHPIVLEDRLIRRGRSTGKWIPGSVVQSMVRAYQAPTQGEFDCVIVEPGPRPTLRQRAAYYARRLQWLVLRAN